MKWFFLFLFPTLAFAQPTKEQQFRISLNTVIKNSTMPDVRPGMVVASPSRSNPDYYYDWVRDTALTYRAMVDYYELKKDPKIKKMIFTWIDSEAYRQNQPTFTGLGEPKYFIDGSGYTGGWGRPQNDGPALRAIAMIKFARILLSEGQQNYVIQRLYHGVIPADSVIKKDLEYTAHHWREPSFDLWEEEMGMHFYTLLAQHVALQEGAKLADELGDGGAATFYRGESAKIAQYLKSEFTDSRIGILTTLRKVNGGLGYKNSNIDVAPLLALLHNSPYQKLFSLNSAPVRKYIEVLTNTFAELYSINKAFPSMGVGIGRYPEDRYDGYATTGVGNPWFLSTLALGEYYCMVGEKSKTMKQFERALFHSDRKGGMSEQFNHMTGHMQGARELTWSHNAFMTAMMRCRFI
ncbi:glycoside hydrolase family 15 protein [Peredibacter sp. HCB2-198]|uniref:glycoside hydrolase family 15 protein n=1 Tax=Peredibacter sp. HCB2-198 TaxID=3383025 RepID=UPI0038B5E506